MNINIINQCNNNCYFCFQHNPKNKNNQQLLTMDQLQNIIAWYNHYTPAIGLLGGEPTLHPELLNFCNRLRENNYDIVMFSNLLCDANLLKELLVFPHINFLFNICHGKQFNDLFNSNFEIVLNRDLEQAWYCFSGIFLGITLTNDHNYNQNNSDYLLQLLKKDKHHVIKGIRISHAIPFNNTYELNCNFGQESYNLISSCSRINSNLNYTFDCPVNFCIFEPELYYKLNKMHNVYNLKLVCEEPVLDINVDGTTSWCACDNEKIYNIFDYPNPMILINEMKKDRYLNMKNLHLNCDYQHCFEIDCTGCCPGINKCLKDANKIMFFTK